MALKSAKLHARPDGTIQWTTAMTEQSHQAFWTEALETQLDKHTSYSQNKLVFDSLSPNASDRPRALMRLLQWHGIEAIECVLPPILATLGKKRIDEEGLKFLLNFHDEQITEALLPYAKLPAVKAVLKKQAARWPLFTLQKLIETNPTRNQATGVLILELLTAHPNWLAPLQAACDEAQLKVIARLLEAETVIEAQPDELPDILRNPRWRNRRALPTVPNLVLEPLCDPIQIHDVEYNLAEQNANHASKIEKKIASYFFQTTQSECLNWTLEHKALLIVGAKPEALERMLSGGSISADDFFIPERGIYPEASLSGLLFLPQFIANKVFQCIKGPDLLEHFGEPFIYYVARILTCSQMTRQLPLLREIDADFLAPALARTLVKNKWAKPAVRAWLARFPETAARGLIPAALNLNDDISAAAKTSLRWLHANGHSASLNSQAMRYGPAGHEALAVLLSIAPEELLPEKLPTLPKSLYLPGLPRLFLKQSGSAIGLAYMPDVLMCLMLSKADEPYAGLASLQEVVEPDSFARLGQALFKWWQDNACPAKERWMFEVQPLLANDETSRQLNLALRQWRAGLNRVRAYYAMNMLAQIGSDVALMHLHTLSQQTKFNDLIERAAELLRGIGEQRGLSMEQLADRTVPDLGLDACGKLNLDFGPRQFSLSLDQRLVPKIKDADGKLLKDLPKPNSKDDATLSKEAVALYKDLKKQLKSIASNQLQRLESAMCAQRRWSSEEFTTLLVRHPLLQHVAQGLIWGVYDKADRLITTCRVAEDLSLSDDEDSSYQLPEHCSVGIAHPLELVATNLLNFSQLLADYQILQPFAQLARETFLLARQDAAQNELLEWVGRKVSTGSLLGLEQRGWTRLSGEESSIVGFSKELGNDMRMDLELDGGWYVWVGADPKQAFPIRKVSLQDKRQQLMQIESITLSEVQRDLHLLAWFVE